MIHITLVAVRHPRHDLPCRRVALFKCLAGYGVNVTSVDIVLNRKHGPVLSLNVVAFAAARSVCSLLARFAMPRHFALPSSTWQFQERISALLLWGGFAILNCQRGGFLVC